MNMEQKEIEALIAAGGAICELCGGRMLRADGCTWPGSTAEASIIGVSGTAMRAPIGVMNAATIAAQSGGSITMPTVMWSNARYAVAN